MSYKLSIPAFQQLTFSIKLIMLSLMLNVLKPVSLVNFDCKVCFLCEVKARSLPIDLHYCTLLHNNLKCLSLESFYRLV
jgi:hypothetical protein